jgi:hypothetical protein
LEFIDKFQLNSQYQIPGKYVQQLLFHTHTQLEGAILIDAAMGSNSYKKNEIFGTAVTPYR